MNTSFKTVGPFGGEGSSLTSADFNDHPTPDQRLYKICMCALLLQLPFGVHSLHHRCVQVV